MPSLVKRAIKSLLILIVAVLVTILLAVAFLLLIGILLYRRFLFHFAKFMRPSLGKMVTTRASSIAAEAFHKSSRVGEVVVLILEGNPAPTIQFLRDVFRERGLELKYPASQQLRFPELRQTVVHFMGYLFWENIPNFNLEDHVYVHPDYKNQPITHEELIKLSSEMVSRPFPKGKAMWELILIPEYIPKASNRILNCNYGALLFRQHHCLSDGFSKMKFLQQFSLHPNTPLKTPEVPEVSWCVKALFYVSLAIKLPFEMADLIVNNPYSDTWIVSTDHNGKPREPLGKYGGTSSEPIDLSLIKEIKNKHGVSFTAVVMTAHLCSLESRMTQFRKSSSDDVLVVMPFPMGKHPDKLRNHFSFAFLYLPVSEKNLVKRLHIIHKRFEKVKRSALPIMYGGYFGDVILSLPANFVKFLIDKSVTNHGAVFTNFPGPTSTMDIFGYNLKEILTWAAGVVGTHGVGGSFVTYGDTGIFGVGSDTLIIPNEDVAEEMVQIFISTLHQLKSAPITDLKNIV